MLIRRFNIFRRLLINYIWPKILSRFDYIIILFLSLHTLIWFQDNLLIMGSDLILPLNPLDNFIEYFFVWDHGIDGGLPRMDTPRILYFGFFAFFDILGLNLFEIEVIFIIVSRFFSGSAIYYLVSTLYETRKNKRMVALLSAIVYMFSPLLILDSYTSVLRPVCAYMHNVMLALYIKGLKHKNINYGILMGFSSVLTLFMFPSLFWIILSLFILSAYTIFYCIYKEKRVDNFKFIIKFTLAFLVIAFLINSFWLLPSLQHLYFYSSTYETVPVRESFYDYNLIDSIRLLSHWAFIRNAGWLGKPYVSYASIYLANPFLIVITFSVPILAFLSLLFRSKNPNIIFFAILAIISLFLAKGSGSPLGGLYPFLLYNVPLFKVFRGSRWFLYITHTCYAVLIASTLTEIYEKISKKGLEKPHIKIKESVIVGLLVILLLNSWPLLTGDVITHWYTSQRGIKIPEYYYDAEKWIDSQKDDYKILLMPTSSAYIATSWGFTGGLSFYDSLFSKQIIYGKGGLYGASQIRDFTDYLYNDLIYTYDSPDPSEDQNLSLLVISKYIGLLSAKYILVDTSLVAHKYMPSIDYAVNMLNNSKSEFTFLRSFGSLLFFENRHIMEPIYGAKKVYVVNGGLKDAKKLLANKNFDIKAEGFILKNHYNGKEALLDEFTSKTRPDISFAKISPTKYVVNVATNNSFALIFSESYNKLWKAFINKKDQIKEEYHFIANGFANGWLIKKTGTFTITLEYEPQKLYYLGSVISFSTITIFSAIKIIPKTKIQQIKNLYRRRVLKRKENVFHMKK